MIMEEMLSTRPYAVGEMFGMSEVKVEVEVEVAAGKRK